MIIDNLNITPLLPNPVITPSGKIRIWITSGQSNCVGQGVKADLFTYNSTFGDIDTNVKIWNGTSFVDINPGVNTNYPTNYNKCGAEITYTKLTRNYFNSGTDYIIKYAWNGTDLKQWLSGGAYRNTFVNGVNSALDAVSADKNTYTCVFVWDQGETVNNATDASNYATDFASMMTDLRSNLDVRSLPVIFRKMRYDIRKNFGLCKETVAQQKLILTSVSNSYMYNEDGGYLTDNIHFDVNSYVEAGKKIFLTALPLWD